MQSNRYYTKKQLVSSIKVVYRLLEYELKNSGPSREYLNNLANSKFPLYAHLFRGQKHIDNMGMGEDYIGKKGIYNHLALKAIDDYRFNNDKLILYRNFSLLLLFMRSLYLPEITTNTIKIKSTILNIIDYKTPIELFRKIFTVGESAEEQHKIKERERKRKKREQNERDEREARGEREEKQEINHKEQKRNTDKTNCNENVDDLFVDRMSNMFKEFKKFEEVISFSFSTAFDRTVKTSEYNTAERTNITQFLNSFDKLLTRSNLDVLKLFLEVYESKYNHLIVPETLVSFMRYYTSRDSINSPMESKYNNVYISGVGNSDFIQKFSYAVGSVNKRENRNLNRKLASDDSNELLKQIGVIQSRSRPESASVPIVIKNDSLLKSTKQKYDVALAIIPKKLDFFSEDQAIKKYPFYPINQISFYAYYEKIMHCIENKSLIIVPISLISSNSYSEKKFSEDIALLDDGDGSDRDPKIVQSAQYQEFLQHYRIQRIIKQKNIKKIMLLPKDMFYHTSEQCVLIEITKQTCHGVQFIDASIYDYFKEKHTRRVSINLHRTSLIYIYDYYGESVFIDPNRGGIIDQTEENSSLISVYVPYENLITSQSLLPSHHIKDNSRLINSQPRKISDFFDVIKIQKSHYALSDIMPYEISAASTTDIKQYSKSDFSPYGITSNDDIVKTIKIATPKKYDEYCGFKKFDLVFNNDILIYAHYYNITDITFAQINPIKPEDNLCFGTHNLIAIRLKEQYVKQDSYAKALFLWLMSNEGQEALKSITKMTSSNRPLISVDDLKMLQVDLSGLDNAKASFRKMENEITKIKKSIKSIQDIIG